MAPTNVPWSFQDYLVVLSILFGGSMSGLTPLESVLTSPREAPTSIFYLVRQELFSFA
jgi:hypothetical protein